MLLAGFFLVLVLTFSAYSDTITGMTLTERITSCTETDKLLDLFTQGTTTEQFGISSAKSEDRCLSSTKLAEYYCEGDYKRKLGFECPNGCSNGACL